MLQKIKNGCNIGFMELDENYCKNYNIFIDIDVQLLINVIN